MYLYRCGDSPFDSRKTPEREQKVNALIVKVIMHECIFYLPNGEGVKFCN